MEPYNKKILLIDSDYNVCQLLKTRLTLHGYIVALCNNGKDAFTKFKKEQPNLLILDMMVPNLDGYTFCLTIRKESSIPIIIITTLDSITDRIIGFKLGIDDYLIKPFYLEEFEARVKSILRRTKISNSNYLEDENILNIGKLKFNFTKKQVLKDQKIICLTLIESNLLELLVTKAGKTLSRNFILSNIWGYTTERYADIRMIDVHISRLRSKLEEDPSNPDLIITEWGKGYMFYKFQK